MVKQITLISVYNDQLLNKMKAIELEKRFFKYLLIWTMNPLRSFFINFYFLLYIITNCFLFYIIKRC